ncbi:hypothetical protein CSAL01_07358, partial [Colletotrichum salicis]
CRAHPAEEVYVTGTFDNWTKSEKLEKVGSSFEKTVTLADASEKIYYKGTDRKQRRRLAQPATASVHPSKSLVHQSQSLFPPSWRGKKGCQANYWWKLLPSSRAALVPASPPLALTQFASRSAEPHKFCWGLFGVLSTFLTIAFLRPHCVVGFFHANAAAFPLGVSAALLALHMAVMGKLATEKEESHAGLGGTQGTRGQAPPRQPPPSPGQEPTAMPVAKEQAAAQRARNHRRLPFVVDNNWITDHTAPQEPDHEGNVNNFLTPDQIVKEDTTAAVMNTVTPESTTAALAKDVPLEKEEELPQATPSDIPGGFPVTPANELDKFIGVNPIPAQDVTAEPVTVAPGEPLPASVKAGDINEHVKIDKEGYEDSSALPGLSKEETTVPEVTSNTIPESSLPMATADATINSAAPTSTTAALAAEVPLETKTAEVPEVVKESQEKAHAEPEASANPEAVQEKAVVEDELLEKTKEETREEVAPEVPTVVKESIAEAGKSPEAAANTEAVIEKKEVEAELLKEVKPVPAVGEETKVEAEKPKVEAAKEEVKETKEEVKEGEKTKTEAVKEEAKLAKEEVKAAVTKDESTNGANGVHTTANGTNGATLTSTKEPEAPTTPAKAPSSVPESTTPSNTKAAESPSGTEKKKKNRLSAFIGKLKAKVHSK